MLRQSDGYLSGQQLCDHFQVSRTAVWKAINQLKEEGYEIEAVRNKGYRIVDIPDRITDGYGLNRNLIDRAFDDGIDTIITCDNGIAAESGVL